MDGIINVKAFGSHISKDSQTAGVRGEANVSHLSITFDESWDGFAKRVIFWDAQGRNPVKRDLVAHEAGNERLFVVAIPGEPLAIAGKMSFVIDGLVGNKVKRSVSDTLVVKDSPVADADDPIEPSPSEFDALRGDVEDLREDIQQAFESEEAAEEYRNEAKQSRDDAQGHENNAYRYSMNAMQHWTNANQARKEAEQFAAQAYNAIGKVPFVGENGNWFAWEGNGETFYDTGVRAQSGAVVYYGENPSDEVDVWINPDGESANYAPYIGENGNWYVFDDVSQSFKDSGYTAVSQIKYMGAIPINDEDEFLNSLFDSGIYTYQLVPYGIWKIVSVQKRKGLDDEPRVNQYRYPDLDSRDMELSYETGGPEVVDYGEWEFDAVWHIKFRTYPYDLFPEWMEDEELVEAIPSMNTIKTLHDSVKSIKTSLKDCVTPDDLAEAIGDALEGDY